MILDWTLSRWYLPHEIFKGAVRTPEFPIERMQLVAPHEVISRYHPVDRIAQDCDIGGRLWEDFMQTKQHVAFEHADFLQAGPAEAFEGARPTR